jgi:hypothetical protein
MGQPQFLAPGGTVTIDKSGTVMSPLQENEVIIKNRHAKHDGDIKVGSGFAGEIEVGGTKYDFPPLAGPQSVKVNSGQHVHIERVPGNTAYIVTDIDAQLTDLTDTVDMCFQCLNNGQTNVELNDGGLESADDTDSFTSIMTPDVITGCPEPGCLFLFGSGMIGVVGLLRRKLTI